LLLGLAWIDYKARLLRLGADSREIRRLRQDLLQAYEVVFSLANNAASEFLTLANSGKATIATRGRMIST